MGVEDQQEEREVLESIFPEEITGIVCSCVQLFLHYTYFFADVSETEFRISIQLEVTPGDEDAKDLQSRTCRFYLPSDHYQQLQQ